MSDYAKRLKSLLSDIDNKPAAAATTVIEIIRENGEYKQRIAELEAQKDKLSGNLQNCVNHLDRAKRKSYTGNYDECIESANKVLYYTALRLMEKRDE